MTKKVILFLMTGLCLLGTSRAEFYGFEFAGQEYDIAPELLRAISMVESGHNPDVININTNISTDVGHMQINSCWKEKLGYRWTLLDGPACCTLVGAWIIRACIDRYGYNWNAVACYHTGYSTDDPPTEKKRSNGRRYIIKVEKAFYDIRVKKNWEQSHERPRTSFEHPDQYHH
jgi:soluble lytic murein transglycosylase-like protein